MYSQGEVLFIVFFFSQIFVISETEIIMKNLEL